MSIKEIYTSTHNKIPCSPTFTLPFFSLTLRAGLRATLTPCARKKSELTDFARAVLFGPQEKGSVQNFVLFVLRAQNYVPCVQNFVLFVLRAPFFDF